MSPVAQQLVGKLALGTVQFGLAYGISNTRGRVPAQEAGAILREAMDSGVNTIDTAEAYAESEATIGSAAAELPRAFEIVSKFPAGVTRRSLQDHLAGSLRRLRVRSLAGYLAHDPAALLDPGIVEALCEARDTGLIGRFGASVYYPREVETFFDRDIDIGLVQIPYSVVDQRFAPLLTELKMRNVQVHARSAFLQGLLLMDPATVPGAFGDVALTIAALRMEAAVRKVPLNALLLGMALNEARIDRVVVGVTSVEELRMNISAVGLADRCRLTPERAHSFVISDESLLLPSNWPR